jgi:hypothetical protein
MAKLLAVAALLLGLANGASACPKETKSTVQRNRDGVLYGCADKAGVLQGMVVVKDLKGNLQMAGKMKDGRADGTWTVFNHSHVVGHPQFAQGVLLPDNTALAPATAGVTWCHPGTTAVVKPTTQHGTIRGCVDVNGLWQGYMAVWDSHGIKLTEGTYKDNVQTDDLTGHRNEEEGPDVEGSDEPTK